MTRMRMRWSSLLFVGGLALLPGCKKGSEAPGGSGPIPATSVPPVIYAADSEVPDKVRQECTIDTDVPKWLAEYAPGAAPGAASDAGRVLQMEITGMMGAAGGVYSGPKQIRMKGTLRDNGTVIGSFEARRTTTGGAWGGYKGTCSLLARTAKALAKDVGAWLQSPTVDARLGELN